MYSKHVSRCISGHSITSRKENKAELNTRRRGRKEWGSEHVNREGGYKGNSFWDSPHMKTKLRICYLCWERPTSSPIWQIVSLSLHWHGHFSSVRDWDPAWHCETHWVFGTWTVVGNWITMNVKNTITVPICLRLLNGNAFLEIVYG